MLVKQKNTVRCQDAYVDGWDYKKVDSNSKKDVFLGQIKIQEKQSERYLWDIISTDGTNLNKFLDRKNRGIGIALQILSLLEKMPLGKYYFQTFVILRNSLLISSILTSCEAWYYLTKKEIEHLNYPDKFILQKLFEVPRTVPTEMFFLELGIIPIQFIIIQRRLIYFQHIMKQEESSLIYSFIKTQFESMKHKDWIKTVIENIQYLQLNLTFSEIKNISKRKFRLLIKKSIAEKAYSYLIERKSQHSKVFNINYNNIFQMQDYLKPNNENITVDQRKYIFHLHTRAIDIKQITKISIVI